MIQFQDQYQNGKLSYLVWVVVLAVFGACLGIFIYLFSLKENEGEQGKNLAESNVAVNKIVPQDAKSPAEFLSKVQERTSEIQKDYDNTLAEFAQKKWENVFLMEIGRASCRERV